MLARFWRWLINRKRQRAQRKLLEASSQMIAEYNQICKAFKQQHYDQAREICAASEAQDDPLILLLGADIGYEGNGGKTEGGQAIKYYQAARTAYLQLAAGQMEEYSKQLIFIVEYKLKTMLEKNIKRAGCYLGLLQLEFGHVGSAIFNLSSIDSYIKCIKANWRKIFSTETAIQILKKLRANIFNSAKDQRKVDFALGEIYCDERDYANTRKYWEQFLDVMDELSADKACVIGKFYLYELKDYYIAKLFLQYAKLHNSDASIDIDWEMCELDTIKSSAPLTPAEQYLKQILLVLSEVVEQMGDKKLYQLVVDIQDQVGLQLANQQDTNNDAVKLEQELKAFRLPHSLEHMRQVLLRLLHISPPQLATTTTQLVDAISSIILQAIQQEVNNKRYATSGYQFPFFTKLPNGVANIRRILISKEQTNQEKLARITRIYPLHLKMRTEVSAGFEDCQ